MYEQCCVPYCKNSKNQTRNGERITYHIFPLHSELRSKWIGALRCPSWTPSGKILVCSQHFRKGDFIQGRLKKGAVPSLFPVDPSLEKRGVDLSCSPSENSNNHKGQLSGFYKLRALQPQSAPLPVNISDTRATASGIYKLSMVQRGTSDLQTTKTISKEDTCRLNSIVQSNEVMNQLESSSSESNHVQLKQFWFPKPIKTRQKKSLSKNRNAYQHLKPNATTLSKMIRFRSIIPSVFPCTDNRMFQSPITRQAERPLGSADASRRVVCRSAFSPQQQFVTRMMHCMRQRLEKHRIDNRVFISVGIPCFTDRRSHLREEFFHSRTLKRLSFT